MTGYKNEIRELMHTYIDRQRKLERELDELMDDEDETIVKCLQRQCRIMIAELFHVMKSIGALDEEEIEFGSIKKK